MEPQENPAKKRVLGKGLSALIDPSYGIAKTPLEVPAASRLPEDSVTWLPISEIVPNPDQPRLMIEEDTLAELAQSIKEQGVIQPVIVTRRDGKYQLICGERRVHASRLAGLEKIPAIVKEAAGGKVLEMALVENLQREDLNAIEEAQAYAKLLGERGLTQEDLASRVGKSRSAVANATRLLSLPREVQDLVVNRVITGGHAKAIVPLPSPEHQRVLARRVVKENLSVRQTEEIAQNMLTGKRRAKRLRRLDPYVQDLERKLEHKLATQVRLFHGKNNHGRIEVRYFSLDDLDRILQALGVEKS